MLFKPTSKLHFKFATNFMVKTNIVTKHEKTFEAIKWCVKFSICTGPEGNYGPSPLNGQQCMCTG